MNWWDEDTPRRGRKKSRRSGSTVRRTSTVVMQAKAPGVVRVHAQRAAVLLLLLVCLVGIIWMALRGVKMLGHLMFAQNDRFQIEQISCSSDGSLEPWRIARYAGVKKGANLFAVDLAAVHEALESVSIINRVKVQRRLPSTLTIQVTERVPVVRFDASSQFPFTVDREGCVLGWKTGGSSLPVLKGMRKQGLKPGDRLYDATVQDALHVVDLCDSTRLGQYIKIQSIDVRNDELLDIKLNSGERVLLARRQIEPRLRKLAAILQASGEHSMRPVVIDMTGDNNVAVRH